MDHGVRSAQTTALRCRKCGNDKRFVEIMSYEAHLVTADLTYVGLLEAEVDYYRCYACGIRVDVAEESGE